jgi:hypothetical protein
MRKDIYLVDHYFHLGLARLIKNNNFCLPAFYPNYIIKHSPLDYPFLYHYIIALIPEKYRENITHYLGGLFDLIQMFMIIFILKQIEQNLFVSFPSYVYYAALISFALSPSHLRVDSRNVAASARPLGELLVMVTLNLTILAYTSKNNWYFLLATLSGTFTLLTSNFSTQAYIFIYLITAILIKDLLFVLLPVCSSVLALILTQGAYLRVIKGQFYHLRYMYKIKHGASVSYFESLRIPTMILKSFKQALEQLYKFPLFILVTYYPFIVFSAYLAIVYYDNIPNKVIFSLPFLFISAVLIIFFLTGFKRTKFLGQAERYLDYTTLFISAFLPVLIYLNKNAEILWFIYAAIMVFSSFLICTNLILWNKVFPSNRTIFDLADFLNKKKGMRIFTFPPNLSYLLSFKTQQLYLFNTSSYDPVIIENIRDSSIDDPRFNKLPLIVNNLKKVIQDYDLTHLVIKKNYSYMSLFGRLNLNELYPLDDYKVIYENSGYVVYETK